MYTEIGIWHLIFYLQQCILPTVSIDIKSNFLVEKNKRINATAYEKAIARSNVICAGRCLSSSNCTAANYNSDSGKCYLFNKMCYLDENVHGWRYMYLTRPPATRTFHHISNQSLTWENAKTYCESIGGGLANVLTTTDQEKIFYMISSQTEDVKIQVWLGGSDRHIEGEWVWSNGCRFEDQDFNFWEATEPNNVNNNEHCLALRIQNSQWNDMDCAENMNFVCEITVPLTKKKESINSVSN